ncbi:MAG TPA: hypothetical protein VFM55_24220 [Micromonosporaceae bacterium]|nr:hypothetical protein [Micromonosporaceae bacterium]
MKWPSPHRGQPADPAAVHDDDLLLTALGQGLPPPAGEPVADLLSTWRAEIIRAAARSLAGEAGPTARRGTARWALRQLVVAATAVVVAAGLATAAFNASPESPLWPVTTAFFPQRANIQLAQEAIHDARQAAAEGRYDDSQRHLEEAAGLVDRLGSDPRIEQLRSEIDAVRTAIPDAGPSVSGTGPADGTGPPAGALPANPAPVVPAPAVPASPGRAGPEPATGPGAIPLPGTARASPPGRAAPPQAAPPRGTAAPPGAAPPPATGRGGGQAAAPGSG